jgi:hypothetical protein
MAKDLGWYCLRLRNNNIIRQEKTILVETKGEWL